MNVIRIFKIKEVAASVLFLLAGYGISARPYFLDVPTGTSISSMADNNHSDVQVQQFTIEKDGCSVRLEWQTIQEKNLKNIQIERSSNGGEFMSITTLTPTGGGHYAYSEDGLGTGRYEYRLKFISNDGKSVNTKTESVSLVCDFNIQVYPVQTKDTIYVSGGISGATINVYDVKGTGVLKMTANGQMAVLSLRNFPAGTYFIGIIKNNELIKQETVVKE